MVATNEVGADNKKMIRSESGAILPASYKSGRYDEWRKSRRIAHRRGDASVDSDRNDTLVSHSGVGSRFRADGQNQARASKNQQGGKSVEGSEIRSAAQILNARRAAEQVSDCCIPKYPLWSLTPSVKRRTIARRNGDGANDAFQTPKGFRDVGGRDPDVLSTPFSHPHAS